MPIEEVYRVHAHYIGYTWSGNIWHTCYYGTDPEKARERYHTARSDRLIYDTVHLQHRTGGLGPNTRWETESPLT